MSIPHFDKLSQKRQQTFLDHPEQFVCQEKVDGSKISIGRTAGKLWVSRKSEKDAIYIPDDWGNHFWVQNFRRAHVVLEIIEQQLVNKFGDEFEIEAEILSKLYPNTIDYEHSMNQIVIFNPEVTRFDVRTQISASFFTSPDGNIVKNSHQDQEYKITGLPSIPQDEWVDIVREIRTPTPEYYTYEMLLDKLVRTRHSVYSDHQTSHVRIEGLVFRHTDGWMLKLVDRTWFTKLNTQNYVFRKKIFRSPGAKGDSIMDIFTRECAIDIDKAVLKAYNAVVDLQINYESDDNQFVNARNYEAIYSTKEQLQAIRDGR